MGSGGGGGGNSPNRKNRRTRGHGESSGEGSNCELTFETDLSAIDGNVCGNLTQNEVLVVGLEPKENFEAVVCRTSTGDYVGTVSHIENLAQLLGCIKAAVGYDAHVRSSSDTHCTVLIMNN